MKKIIFAAVIMLVVLCYAGTPGSKGNGGPDSYGYYWIDSDDVAGPAYNWIDISSTGTALYLDDEELTSPINIGFNFSFYGNSYSTVKISSNGFLTFTDTTPIYENTPLPSTTEPDDILAVFWNDLNPGVQGAIYHYQDTANGRFIVQYDSIVLYGQSTPNTFQVIINSDNTVIYQYKDMQGTLDACTVGIENYGGTIGLQVVYNNLYLKNSLAIKFYAQEIVYGGTISYSATSINFGNVTIGKGAKAALTVNNLSSTEILQVEMASSGVYTINEFSGSKNTVNFTINPSTNKTFDIWFDPVLEQSYPGYITVISSDAANPTDSIALSGNGAYPNISVSQTDTLRVNVSPGSSANAYFNINNTGAGLLQYGMRLSGVSKGSGGPDSFGYTWKDSDASGGPVYDWVEISGIGTSLTLSDDQTTSAINLGFDTKFYGNTFNSVRICSNGFLSFTSSSNQWSNVNIPNTGDPNNLLAVFWDDLDPSLGGTIHYYYDSIFKRFIVQYTNIKKVGSQYENTFQAVIYSDGTIVYQYKKVLGALNSLTVGIENSIGTVGLQVVANSTYLKDNLAVEFNPNTTGWLAVSPVRGYISASSSQQVTAAFNATSLTAGIYYANIFVDSSDPDTQHITVPVKFSVYELTAPQSLTTSVSAGTLTLSWQAVPYATGYKIYSSNDPYGTFVLDTTGTFSGTTWYRAVSDSKKFYRVTAVDAK
jgi:large repetitive protein